MNGRWTRCFNDFRAQLENVTGLERGCVRSTSRSTVKLYSIRYIPTG
jgi:hypothetical protein